MLAAYSWTGRKGQGRGCAGAAAGTHRAGGGTWLYHLGLAQRVLRVLQRQPVGVELALQRLLLAQALRRQLLHQAGLRLLPVQDARQLLVLLFLLHDGFLVGLDLPVDGHDLVLAFAERLLDGPVGLVAVLHAHQAGCPLLQDAPFLHVDGVDLRAGLAHGLPEHPCVLGLGAALSLQQRDLLLQPVCSAGELVHVQVLLLLLHLRPRPLHLRLLHHLLHHADVVAHVLLYVLHVEQVQGQAVQLRLQSRQLFALVVSGLAGPGVEQARAPQLLLPPPPGAGRRRVQVVAPLQLHLQLGQVLLDPVELHAQLLPLHSALLGGHAQLLELQLQTLYLAVEMVLQRGLEPHHQGVVGVQNHQLLSVFLGLVTALRLCSLQGPLFAGAQSLDPVQEGGDGPSLGLCTGRLWGDTWLLQAGLLCAHEQLLRVRGRDAASLAQSEAVSRPQRKHFLLQPVTGLFRFAGLGSGSILAYWLGGVYYLPGWLRGDVPPVSGFRGAGGFSVFGNTFPACVFVPRARACFLLGHLGSTLF